jgi:hypothetical protein
MKIKLSWLNTSDYLIFDCINEDLCEWFVQKSHELDSKFTTANMITDVPRRSHDTQTLISEINDDIDRVNEFLPRLKQPTINKPTNWFDQEQLNNLHKEWARSRQQVPTLPELLHKIDQSLFDAYQETNCHIHLIEDSFYYTFRDNDNHWRLTNPFKDNMYDWQVCHLFLPYPGHGRSAFEKFRNFDEDVFKDDLCNWDNIDSCLGVNLTRPYKLEPPQEFLEWCKKHGNLVPHRETIPMANLENWKDNLAEARQIFTENNKILDNHFALEII